MYQKKNQGLKVIFDDSIKEAVLDVFACLIPKEGKEDEFDHERAYKNFFEFQKMLPLDETNGDIWVFYRALDKLSQIKLFDYSFEFKLDRLSFLKGLEVNITDLMFNNKSNFEDYLGEAGLENDLNIAKNLRDGADYVYSQCEETFNTLQENPAKESDALKYIDILKDLLLTNLAKQTVTTGASIITGESVYINGKYYKGAKGYIEYTEQIKSLVSSRFTDYLKTKRTEVALVDAAAYKKFDQDDSTKVEKLFNIGLEPLDEVFCISTGDLITLVGDEGVGKTNTAIHFAMQAMLAGHSVLMMTGESSLTKIKNMCLSNYIYRKTGLQCTAKELTTYTQFPEDVQRQIEVCIDEFAEDINLGKLFLKQTFSYETVGTEIRDYITKYPSIKFIIIDHTDRLSSTGGLTEEGFLKDKKARVDYLFKKEIELKQTYNVAFLNLAHSSSDAQKAGVKGKDAGVRIGATSSSTSKDADFVFHLSKDPAIPDDFVKWSCKKVRDYRDSIPSFILKKHFEVSELIYDVEYQTAGVKDSDLELEELF